MHFVSLFRLPMLHMPSAIVAAAPVLLEGAVVSTGLIAVLVLFFSLKREIQVVARRGNQRVAELAARVRESEELTLEARDAREGEWTGHSIAPQFRSGFNLNKRVQAIRLLRRGEGEAHISAALGVPRKEVELLVRVQSLAANAGSALNLLTGSDGKS